MNIAGTTQFPARMGMRAPSYGYTTNRDIHGGVQPSLTRRGRLVGDMIRGLKPTAKFCCRYAANMRLQPTTNAPRPRVSVSRLARQAWERRRPARMGVCVWASDRGLKPIVGLHLMHRRVATDEFRSWVHPRWVSTHGSRSPHTPMRAGCPRSQAVRHYATIPGVAMRRGAGWDTLSPALELCVRLGLGEGRGQAESIAANTAGDGSGKPPLRGLKPVRGYVLVLGGVF